VSCSDAIPVAAAIGRDDRKFKQGLRLIAHYFPPPCAEGGTYFNSRLPLDVFVRVLEFADAGTALSLGRTSKALRLEWLKRPTIGPYTLLSASASAPDGEFVAQRRSPCACQTFYPIAYVPQLPKLLLGV